MRGPAFPRPDLARRMAEGLARPHRIADLEPQPLHAAAPQVEVVRGGAVVVLDLHARAAFAKHGGEIPVGRGAHPVRVAALTRARIGVKLAGAWVQVGWREVQRRAPVRVRSAGEVPRFAGAPRQAQLRGRGGRAPSRCDGAPVLEIAVTGAAIPGGGRAVARVGAGCGSRRRDGPGRLDVGPGAAGRQAAHQQGQQRARAGPRPGGGGRHRHDPQFFCQLRAKGNPSPTPRHADGNDHVDPEEKLRAAINRSAAVSSRPPCRSNCARSPSSDCRARSLPCCPPCAIVNILRSSKIVSIVVKDASAAG